MTPSKEAETEPKKSLFEEPFEGGVLAVRITILGGRFLISKWTKKNSPGGPRGEPGDTEKLQKSLQKWSKMSPF